MSGRSRIATSVCTASWATDSIVPRISYSPSRSHKEVLEARLERLERLEDCRVENSLSNAQSTIAVKFRIFSDCGIQILLFSPPHALAKDSLFFLLMTFLRTFASSLLF